ncbi:D-inositol 3-phosphate glycosyltransferase [Arthrobacter saudimassiliensis]|uniref:D-inositol-3-phosphate glycosyltransferase n=1 Tax=Arthrobacter saudimassiliensis TaxID=1461584 RepID=A0A078MQX4_9MICC|nr:D-inositol 3-phosphate glycosyltransferase [Arthrobacter saudimassiliensis]
MLSLHTSPLEQPGSGDAGGMNVYVRSAALELARSGIDVDIYTRASSPSQPDTVRLGPGVVVRHVVAGPLRRVAKEDLPRLSGELAHGVCEAGAGQAYDLLHSHYWISGIAGLDVARAWGLPLVHTMHTMAQVKNQRLQPGEHPEPPVRIHGEQQVVDGAARLIANTATEAAELRDLYGADPRLVDVVAPGVDLRLFHPHGRATSRAALRMPPETFHVVFAGRIQRLKGPHVLLHAAADLVRRRPDIPLAISVIGAGSGAQLLDLKPMVSALGLERRVTLHEPVQAAALAGWFRSADVVAVPSFSESFGLVALEAQACGTPVAAANVGGLPEALGNGRSGVLVDGHAPEAWSRALERLHDDPAGRTALGAAAAARAQNFGWQHTAALTGRSYEAAVAQHHAFSLPH